mgnify:FL=1
MAIVMETIQHKFNWFSLVVGVILFVAGIVTFIHLGTTLEFISIIIGATAVVKGLYELWFKHVLDTTTEEKTLGLFAMGIVDLVLGFLFIFKAATGAQVVAYIFALWFIFDAIVQLATSKQFKNAGKVNYVWMIVLNVIALILGIALLFNPLLASIAIVWIVSIYLVVTGISQFIAAF